MQETQPDRPSSPPEPRRRLVRNTDDKVIAGVCSGIADHFGIDPVMVRVAAIALTFFGGSGVLIYLAAWLLIPAAGEDRAIGDRIVKERRTAQIVGWVLIAIAFLVVGDWIWWDDNFFSLPLAMIGLGAFLLWQSSSRDKTGPAGPPPAPPPASPPPPPSPGAADTTIQDSSPTATAVVDAPPPAADVPDAHEVAEPAKARERRSVLSLVAVGLLLVGAGILGLILAAGWSVDASRVFGGGLLVVGAAMVAGTWFGRASALIPLGILLLAGLSVASLITVPFAGGVGERREHPVSARDLEDEYRLAIGELELDLSDIGLPRGSTEEVEATVAIGELHIIVPHDIEVIVHGEAGGGNIDLFNDERNGVRVDHDARLDGPEGAAVLILDAGVGVGEVRVDRAAS